MADEAKKKPENQKKVETKEKAEGAEKRTCFIIMPITTPPERIEAYGGDEEHFMHVLDYLFVPAVEGAGLAPIRPISEGAPVIHGDIIRNLETADLVLCDMSVLNANVFFELGIRTAVNKGVCLVRDDRTKAQDLPFDTRLVNSAEYPADLSPWKIETSIPRLVKHITASVDTGEESDLWRHFSMSMRADTDKAPATGEEKTDYLIKLVESIAGRQAFEFLPRGVDPDFAVRFKAKVLDMLHEQGVHAARSMDGSFGVQTDLPLAKGAEERLVALAAADRLSVKQLSPAMLGGPWRYMFVQL